MADPYHNFLNYGLYSPYYNAGQNGQPLIQPNPYYGGNLQFQHQPLALDSLNTQFPDFEDPNHPVLPAQGSARTRRRVGPGGDQVKFRRTRSGCFTCRNRRVKCDEAHPICERCRKGGRECVYPEPTSSAKRRSSTKSKSANDGEGSSPDEDEFDEMFLEDEESPTASLRGPTSATSPKAPTPDPRAASDPPALSHGASPTPSTEGSGLSGYPGRPQSTTPARQLTSSTMIRPPGGRKLADLPPDIRFYLNYARTKLNQYHWGLKIDWKKFVNTTLIEVALRFDPLLYAVVGFAAYHCTLSKPDGQLKDFLGYYQKSVKLLRQTFKQKPTLATILTILQLATIEEFLGDWVNLASHQRAALSLMTQLYTPHTINANESLRKIFHWYIRYDTYVSILSGSGTQLGREWLEVQHQFYAQKCSEEPDELCWKYEEKFAWIRLRQHMLGQIIKQRTQNTISDIEFERTIAVFEKDASTMTKNIDPALTDPSKLVKDFPPRPDDFDSIVDPYEPDIVYGGDNWDTNVLIYDLLGTELLWKNQLGTIRGQSDGAELRRLSLEICQRFEAVEQYPGSPHAIQLGMQAGFAMALLFVRQDDTEINWGRKKLASIEALGYTYPASLRSKFETLWGVDLSDWWLPNDEGCPPLMRQIRNFITSTPSDESGENLRDMKGVFATLSLSDTSSPESSHNSPTAHDSRPSFYRQNSIKTPGTAGANSEDGSFDWESVNAHDRAVAYSDSPEFEWN